MGVHACAKAIPRDATGFTAAGWEALPKDATGFTAGGWDATNPACCGATVIVGLALLEIACAARIVAGVMGAVRLDDAVAPNDVVAPTCLVGLSSTDLRGAAVAVAVEGDTAGDATATGATADHTGGTSLPKSPTLLAPAEGAQEATPSGYGAGGALTDPPVITAGWSDPGVNNEDCMPAMSAYRRSTVNLNN